MIEPATNKMPASLRCLLHLLLSRFDIHSKRQDTAAAKMGKRLTNLDLVHKVDG